LKLKREKTLKIVLTNDDGIDSPGLDALVKCVRQLGEAIIIAPQHAQSGIAHRVTTRDPIRIHRLGKNRHSVDGTPADCARIALKVIAPDASWLISGINAGANLGSDVYNSGTVAAAREAAILGYPAVAVSQYIAKNQQVEWAITGYHTQRVLQMLFGRNPGPGQVGRLIFEVKWFTRMELRNTIISVAGYSASTIYLPLACRAIIDHAGFFINAD
jgi:5'/3'-nucleotidase SurE